MSGSQVKFGKQRFPETKSGLEQSVLCEIPKGLCHPAELRGR